jgi:hypothetical protein
VVAFALLMERRHNALQGAVNDLSKKQPDFGYAACPGCL